MPNNESAKDNMGYEQDRDLQPRGSLDSLPEPERPPLRHIDTYCMPECPCLSKRYTIATLACLGNPFTQYIFPILINLFYSLHPILH